MKKTEKRQLSCGRQWLRFAMLGAVLVLLSVLLIACGSKQEITLEYTMNASKDGYIVSYPGAYQGESLIIPAQHEGLPVVSVVSYAFDLSPNLKSVVFEDVSRMTIEKFAFQACPALKSVVFKGTDISKLTIEKQAFDGCSALKSVIFGEDQLEELVLQKSAFGDAAELEELSFAGDEKTEITIPANAFPKVMSIDRLSFKGGTVQWTHSTEAGYVVNVEEMKLGNANLTSSYVNITAEHLTVSGGSLSLSGIGHIEIEKSSFHEYLKEAIPKATFAEGITLEEGKYQNYYTTGIFNVQYHYKPYASEIYLPTSVTSIPANFFGDEGECTVFYSGTLEQWNQVTIEAEGNANYDEGRVTVKTAESQKYTVEFKGTNGAVLADPITVEYGSVITAPDVTAPEGSALTGWYLDAELTEKWDFNTHKITENVTLYAGFASKEELEKTDVLTHEGFERADQTFTMRVSHETSEISLASAFTVSPHATWIISRDEIGTKPVVGKIMLQPGDNVYYLRVTSQNGEKTATYTLQIYREKLCTVTYQPQNGEAEVHLSLKQGTKLENKQFTKTGYRLNGWYLNGEKVDFETFTVNDDCTLVADWRPLQYTVSFASDTGVADVSVEYGVMRSLPVPVAGEQYAFDGWMDGNGTPFTDATGKMLKPYSLLQDVTLYPAWKAIDYTITYKGVEGLANKNPATYTADSATILLQSVSRPSYEFVGWFNGETPVSVIPTGSKGHLILEAKWKPITYTVTYLDTRGASLVGLPTSFSVESDTLLLSEIAVPHYTFQGWYNANGQRVTAIAAGSHENVVLYARFAPDAYTVTYKNVFDAVNGNPTSYTVEDADITLDDLTRPWYSFTGWYSDEACTQRVSIIDTVQGKDITLYAGWNLASYEAKYYVDGNLLTTLYFTYENRQLDDPEVPAKEGYIGKWSAYSIAPKTLHIHAEYSSKPYSITYKGAESHSNPTQYSYETPTFTLTGAVKKGYNFLGWFDEKGEKVSEITKGTTGDLTLTARFELAEYSITYENVHGVDTSAFPSSFTMESNAITLPTSIEIEGCTFKGWLLNGEKVTEIPTGTVGDVVLTAAFDLTQYSITYVGAEDHGNPVEYNYETPTVTLVDAVKKGYEFLGWFDKNGEKVTEIVRGTTGDLTLTARFELAEYTITYENVHGVDISAFPTSFTMESDAITLPESVEIEGCTFKGWLLNGEKVTEIPTGTVGDVVLTAEFDLTQYSITYVGAEGHDNPTEYNYETDTIILADAVKEGCSFLGWFDEKGDKVTEIVRGTTGDLTLTARFELAEYSITYENVHGADTSKFPSSFTVESDPITLPAMINVDGYTFNGWMLNGKRVTVIPKGTVGDVTLTANLTPTVYTIILEPVGGTLSKNTFTVEMGGMLDLPVPKQEGKVFLGWFDNTGADALQYTDAKGDAIIPYEEKAGRVLYAHWAVVVCNITFETNGGESVATKQFAYGAAFDSEIVTQKEDAVFDGWYTVDGSIEYTSTTRILGDVTLYARWVESTPISTAEEFLAIAQNPAGNYYLTNDINLKGNFWTPIESFTGKLDGRGYTVKNFIVSATSLGDNFGMIYENSGVIENLTLADYTFNVTAVSGNNSIGALVGTNKGIISNCTLESGAFKATCDTGSTTIGLRIGGLVGTNDSIITQCHTYVNIVTDLDSTNRNVAHCYIGGLIGYNDGKTTYSSAQCSLFADAAAFYYRWYDGSSIHVNLGGLIGCNNGSNDISGNRGQCYASYSNVKIEQISYVGDNSAHTTRVGGLVGYNIQNGRIDSCYSNGTIEGGAISSSSLGGLVGSNESLGMVVSCYSTVDITTDRGGDVGGLVGYNAANVQNCYATGDVLSTAAVDIGALVGENASAGTVFKCYCAGDVTAPGDMCGFFVGRTSGVLNKCYYLRGTSLLVNGVYKTHVIEYETVQGLPHGDLWSREFLVDQLYWDEEGWVILINEDPVLDWELAVDHNYEITVVEPTCEDFGYSLYVCNDCTRFFVRDFVQPYGHARAEVRIFEPTCTGEGYAMYTCHRCDEIQTVDHQDPLGHNWQHIKHVDESCTVDGYELYECDRCGEEKKDIITAAHKPITSLKGVPAVCIKHISEDGIVTFETTNGYTDEISCSVCKAVLEASEVVLPHSFEITNTTSPTCIEAGYGIYTCKHCGYAKNDVVPAIGHVDLNEDVRCDICGELCGNFDSENAIHITTVEQLLAISKDLNGTYILDADLNLDGVTWTPIGTKNAPFTGFFYGNGHKISNLFVTNTETGGVFGYNRGVINGLTVDGMTVDLLNVNSVVGGIVAHNEGLVINCSLTGTVKVTMSTSLVINTVVTVRESYEIIVGGLIGENVDTGTVKLCSNSAIIEIYYSANSDIQTVGEWWKYFTRDHKKTNAALVSNEVFGGLVGRNNGMITECTVSGKINSTVHDPVAMVTGGEGAMNHRIGYASTIMNAFYGTLVGINAGTIKGYECTTEVSVVRPDWVISKNNSTGLISAFNQQFFGHVAECHYYSEMKTGGAVGMNYPYGVVTD